MEIVSIIAFGVVAGSGAAYRAYEGYRRVTKKKYKDWNWSLFAKKTVPAVLLAFVAGWTVSPVPSILTAEGVILASMLFSGGAGVASLQGKVPFLKGKL